MDAQHPPTKLEIQLAPSAINTQSGLGAGRSSKSSINNAIKDRGATWNRRSMNVCVCVSQTSRPPCPWPQPRAAGKGPKEGRYLLRKRYTIHMEHAFHMIRAPGASRHHVEVAKLRLCFAGPQSSGFWRGPGGPNPPAGALYFISIGLICVLKVKFD